MAHKNLPPLVTVPPASIRTSLGSTQWEACMDAWISLGDLYFRMPINQFPSHAELDSLILPFLISFYHERRQSPPSDQSWIGPKAKALQQLALRLTWRLVKESKPFPKQLLDWEFLTNLSCVHARNQALPKLLEAIWKADPAVVETSSAKAKSRIAKDLEIKLTPEVTRLLTDIAPLLQASPRIAGLFFTGSDLFDTLLSVYDESKDDSQRKSIVAVVYFGLIALPRDEVFNYSLLADHLYGLKAAADKAGSSSSLLADLVTNTSLISRLKAATSEKPLERLRKILDASYEYRSSSIARPSSTKRRPARSKGKGPATNDEFHIHQMSLVSQIQDLFPDLGSGFILKLLDEYNDDIEQITASLLDSSLPPHLENLDHTEQAPITDRHVPTTENLIPNSTPPLSALPDHFIPFRRNIYDNDELDNLQHDASRLHLGKKDTNLSTDSTQPNKAAILSALAAFDSDDDERDDTYDIDDVGGTIDTKNPDGEPSTTKTSTSTSVPFAPTKELDMLLYANYKSHPELFGRESAIRLSQPRLALVKETGMSHEALEGWALILSRDSKRLRTLEMQSMEFDGRQAALPRVAYRASETEDSDSLEAIGGENSARGGRGRGRGGRGRGGRGGGVGRSSAGGSSGHDADGEKSSANAQRRKEVNKSSRANHNRRNQRAKKLARAGFPG